MKNLKILMVALALLALPAVAFGQTTTVKCDVCTHDVSVFMGEGGLVAKADGAEKVTWMSTCMGVTRTDTLTPNDDGMVSMLFTMDNGRACSATGEDMGSFQIGPVTDGGWFWITDDMNSAVGGLVAKDIQDNDTVEITSAGSGVTMTAGTGATYLKETATGRVGILPTILAEPPMDHEDPQKCGDPTATYVVSVDAAGKETKASAYKHKCMVGDGGAVAYATLGKTVIKDGDTIERPANAEYPTKTVVIDLWANGSGHFNPAAAGSTGWLLGNMAATAKAADRTANRLTGVSSAIKVGGGAYPDTATEADHGVAQKSTGTTANTAEVEIKANDNFCGAGEPTSLSVTVYMKIDSGGAGSITPKVVTRSAGGEMDVAATRSFTVVCPEASPNLGTELVPDNPFPTE